MVRKIPVRKYRGKIKDPLGLIERRNAEGSINSAPKNPNEQEIPRSILEIKRLCERVKSFKDNGKKRKNKKLLNSQHLFGRDPRLPGMKKPDSQLPKIVQCPGESKDHFFQRFYKATEDVMEEAKIQEKHAVTINRDASGSIKGFVNDSSSDDDDGNKKNKRKILKTSSNGINKNIGNRKKKLNKKQRIKLRKIHQQGSDDELPEVDFSMFKDEVKFGEVVHRPPQLKAPRGSASLNNRPGIKNLLLKDLLQTEESVGKSKKKENISAAQKSVQEINRLAAVAAYRQLKVNRMKQTS